MGKRDERWELRGVATRRAIGFCTYVATALYVAPLLHDAT